MDNTTSSLLPRCVPWALDRAESGHCVAVTRRGKSVAVIVPVRYFDALEEAREAGFYKARIEESMAKAAEPPISDEVRARMKKDRRRAEEERDQGDDSHRFGGARPA